jgi:anti-anti-sigma factor
MSGFDPNSFKKPFQMEVEPNGDSVLVRLAGEFDVTVKKEFETRFAAVTSKSPSEVIIDLRDVAFIDSAGLSLILEAWSCARRWGFAFAVLLNDRVREIFQETGLDQVLPIIERSSPPT